MSEPTKGPWRAGRAGTVVSDEPTVGALGGSDETEYYGGYLIAESIAPSNVPIIAAAWDMLAALKEVEAHHAAINDRRGRPQENSETLRIVREAIAKATA